jgi:peptide chain release factor 3
MRTRARVRIKGSHRLFARDREAVGEAYPGDIIGLANTGGLRLGDTLCEGEPVRYEPLPQFSPERFAVARCADPGRRKQFAEGLRQLGDEGAVQVFADPGNVREPILAAVGDLQFDVVKFRLESEYGVKADIEPLAYRAAGWVEGDRAALEAMDVPHGLKRVTDHRGRPALLGEDAWSLTYCQGKNPGVTIRLFSEQLFVPTDDA